MTTEDVEEEILSAYRAHIKSKRGNTPGVSEQLKKFVSKAAQICMSLNADPVAYVRAQVKFCSLKEFFPNQLCTSQAANNYKAYMEKCVSNPDELFDVQLRYLSDAIEAGRNIESVLLDDLIDLRPWFRICISEQPIESVIDTFQERAMAELTGELEELIRKKNLDITRIKGNYGRS